jgi:hypothetical protein
MRHHAVHHAVHPIAILLGLFLLVIAASACQPLPAAHPVAGTSAAATPAPSGAGLSASPSPAAPAATPSAAPAPVALTAEEEDCMAACHIPDPNEFFDAGAGPQPASHVARKACLSCHSTAATPPMPADHAGRQDPSCALCHKEAVKPG